MNPHYKTTEIAFIRNHYRKDMTAAEIGEALGRSAQSVITAAWRNGICTRSGGEDLALIADMIAAGKTAPQIADTVGRAAETVRRRVRAELPDLVEKLVANGVAGKSRRGER